MYGVQIQLAILAIVYDCALPLILHRIHRQTRQPMIFVLLFAIISVELQIESYNLMCYSVTLVIKTLRSTRNIFHEDVKSKSGISSGVNGGRGARRKECVSSALISSFELTETARRRSVSSRTSSSLLSN